VYIVDAAKQERDKYTEIWSLPSYRDYSPGRENVDRFLSVMKPDRGQSLIDIGCGTGEAGLALEKHGLRVHWLDITNAALDPEISRANFIGKPIWSDWCRGAGWEYGFCCDVLEHMPTEYAMLAVDRIIANCDTAWLQICFVPDEFGKAIGEPLHLTVRPFSWWLVRMATLGTVIDARDLGKDGLFVVKR